MNNEAKARAFVNEKLEKNSHVVEPMKKYLRKFSKHLRRDFLYLLVRMSSQEFNIPTVRYDWRTRKGMLSYLADIWPQLKELIIHDTFFKWFCLHFSQLDTLLLNRKFVMFIYKNWEKYKSTLTHPNIGIFLALHITQIEQLLSNADTIKEDPSSVIAQFEPGPKFCEIINDFIGVEKAQTNKCLASSEKHTEVRPEIVPEAMPPSDILDPLVVDDYETYDTYSVDDYHYATQTDDLNQVFADFII